MSTRETLKRVLRSPQSTDSLAHTNFVIQKTNIMRIHSAFVMALGLAAAQSFAGEITGTVTLNGAPPAERPITWAKEDANCGKLITETPTTHFYVVGPNKELADTIVMLKNVSGKSTGASAA